MLGPLSFLFLQPHDVGNLQMLPIPLAPGIKHVSVLQILGLQI